MRRRLTLVTTAVFLALAGSITVAGAASAGPPDKANGEHDCRFPAATCHPGLHQGADKGRNVGG
jgi:hypothetical protein